LIVLKQIIGLNLYVVSLSKYWREHDPQPPGSPPMGQKQTYHSTPSRHLKIGVCKQCGIVEIIHRDRGKDCLFSLPTLCCCCLFTQVFDIYFKFTG